MKTGDRVAIKVKKMNRYPGVPFGDINSFEIQDGQRTGNVVSVDEQHRQFTVEMDDDKTLCAYPFWDKRVTFL